MKKATNHPAPLASSSPEGHFSSSSPPLTEASKSRTHSLRPSNNKFTKYAPPSQEDTTHMPRQEGREHGYQVIWGQDLRLAWRYVPFLIWMTWESDLRDGLDWWASLFPCWRRARRRYIKSRTDWEEARRSAWYMWYVSMADGAAFSIMYPTLPSRDIGLAARMATVGFIHSLIPRFALVLWQEHTQDVRAT